MLRQQVIDPHGPERSDCQLHRNSTNKELSVTLVGTKLKLKTEVTLQT